MPSSTSALFSPLKLGTLQLNHRVVLAPLTRIRANSDAVPNDLMKKYYSQRTTDGGLLITEATFIDRLAGSYLNVPRIYSKGQIIGWKKVTDEVHSKGGFIFLQMIHLGLVASASLNERKQHVSASAIAVKGKNMSGALYKVLHALSIPEIKAVINQFRQSALNAVEAGFDGVEIHGANGYLVDQFINTSSNKRTDAYGGSIENRGRFALEIVDAIVDAIGAELTAISFSPWAGFQDMEDETPYETWGYLTKSLQENHLKLAYLHYVEPRGDAADGQNKIPTNSLDPFRCQWTGPFISADGYFHNEERSFDRAEKTGNFIAFGCQFLANPDLVDRLRNVFSFNKYNRNTFYGGDATGYTDYPFYKE